MSNLQVKDIDEHLYNALRAVARSENRSISQEVIRILEDHLANPSRPVMNATREFLSLSGSWVDVRPAEKIAKEIKASRKNSSRFGGRNVVFD